MTNFLPTPTNRSALFERFLHYRSRSNLRDSDLICAKPPSQIMVAVHEIGHAAVSRSMGFGCWSCEILRCGSGLFKPAPKSQTPSADRLAAAAGCGHFTLFSSSPIDEITTAAAALALGGLVAEQLHSGQQLPPNALFCGGSVDELHAELYLSNRLDRLAVQAATFDLLEPLLPAIRKTAEVLGAVGYLNAEQLEMGLTGRFNLMP